MNQMDQHYDGLMARCDPLPALPTAVVHPVQATVFEAVNDAAAAGLISPVLIGPAARIAAALTETGQSPDAYPVIDTEHSHAAADKAAELAATEGSTDGVLAGEVAAEINGLTVLARDIEDMDHNTTRFLLMAPKIDLSRRAERMLTTFVFEVRNIPAALYKAMGGFATNGVNMTKLESYMVGGSFTATQFYADIEGHPEDPAVKRALDELGYFTNKLEILGAYPAHPGRGAPTGM